MTGLKEVVGEELSLGYPLFQRLHNNNHPRPLIPKPYLSSTNHNNNNSPSSYLNRLPQHHHNFGTNKGDEGNNNNNNNKDNNVSMTHNQVMVSSRWNPTPEQLSALEELYRCGTRTPSAEQIQHITAQLGRYGKIEGKNVFYWFQNHKARERQKRRRLLTSTTTIHANHSTDNTQEGFQNEEKSCKRTSLIKSKEYDPPIDSNLGPRKADKISSSSSNNNSSTNNNECLHFHENCAQFQHNYNILSPKHTHFMTSSQNQTNVNYNNINNINISNINNININNNNNNNTNNNINLQPCLSSFHDLKNVTTKTTTSVTLQLFPVSEQEEEEDDDDDVVDELKAKKDRQDILSSLGKNDNENVMSCMDSNYFVPYYQFL